MEHEPQFTCPRPGCERSKRQEHFCCSPCWWLLPHHLRAVVLEAWNIYQADANQSGLWEHAQQLAFYAWRHADKQGHV